MADDSLHWMPASAMAPLIRQKRLSPVEVMTAVLDRIERHEPRIQRLRASRAAPEAAMAAAREAEAAVSAGKPVGPLHGVPITIKDLVRTKDMPTQSGSRINKGHQPDEDAPVVQRLKAAGAIILGKTTTPEFGWKGVSESPLTGITHTPWKHGINAGASAAGAAASAAAGFAPPQPGRRRRRLHPHDRAFLRHLRPEAHLWPRCLLPKPSKTWGWSCRVPKRTQSPSFCGGMIVIEAAVDDGCANLEHQMSTPWRPSHLLLGCHPTVQKPLHRAFGG